MAVERYDLGAIKRRIRNEFHLEDTPETSSFLVEKINEAHLHIARQRGRWYWQVKEEALDVSAAESIVVTATNGSRILALTDGTLPTKRAVLAIGSSDYGTQGYLVVSTNGDQITLNRQWLEVTGSHTISVQVGYIPLPDDFYALETKEEISNITGARLVYMDNQRFQFVRNKSQLSIATERICTVLGDPIKEPGTTRYLAVYPYYGNIDTLYYTYFFVPEQLVDDQDEPILPIGDRPVLVAFSLWFVAQAKGYDKVMLYRDMALGDMQLMLHHASEDATLEMTDPGHLTLDMSATRGFDLAGDELDYNPHVV